MLSSKSMWNDGKSWSSQARTHGHSDGRARVARYDSTRVARPAMSGPGGSSPPRRMPAVTDPPNSTPGRSLVSRRAIVDVVRAATLGSYGVIGFAHAGGF